MLARTARVVMPRATPKSKELFAAATRRPPRILAPLSRVMLTRNLAIHCNQGTASTMRDHLFVMPARGMARYEGEMPQLGPDDFVVLSPEVSGPGGMSVPAELGEIMCLNVKEGDQVKEDMVVAEIETCKASVEARCRTAGVVKKILVQEGEEVWELQPLLVVTRTS